MQNTWHPGDAAIAAKSKEIAAVVTGLSQVEKNDFSVTRAIRHLAGLGEEAALEREVSVAIEKKLGRPAQSDGLFIPTRLAAGLDTKTNAAGKYSVATDVRDLIELLRNQTKVARLGATILTGLSSDVSFPVQLTGSAGYWVSENPGADVNASDATFGSRNLSPKIYQATTSFSRKLLAQSSIDIEGFVRKDLATAHALAIDAAALNGSGASNQPLGLLKTTGIGDVAIGTNGGVPTYAFITDLITKVADANGDEQGSAFLTTPGVRGKLRKTGILDSATAGVAVWESGSVPGEGSLAGYPAMVSKQVPANLVKGTSSDCHAIVFGYWPSLIIGEWGVIELVVDPYALKKQGQVEVTSLQMIDVICRQPAQFAAIQDARLA